MRSRRTSRSTAWMLAACTLAACGGTDVGDLPDGGGGGDGGNGVADAATMCPPTPPPVCDYFLSCGCAVDAGEKCVIGALSVVPKHSTLESGAVYAGAPVKRIDRRAVAS